MKRDNFNSSSIKFSEFDRNKIGTSEDFTCLGKGTLGGKASGLAFIREIINSDFDHKKYPSVKLSIPRTMVIRSEYFEAFMDRNNLWTIATSYDSDSHIAQAFYRANLPTEILGDLWTIADKVQSPLAIRSSSFLEDGLNEPFAGIYGTKMISNNKLNAAQRFEKLTEAIKFVYASTFFSAAKNYMRSTPYQIEQERMSVIIQRVIGRRYNDRFYPNISGVAKSYNYYTSGKFKPENGIVNLALGLGKTIVEGDITWPYSPAQPKKSPPFNSPKDILNKTQNKFWAVNMGQCKFNPINEDEYLVQSGLPEAEHDGALKLIASTYNNESDRIMIGMRENGPRVLNFAPFLVLNDYRFNEFLIEVIKMCENAFENPVEIEFAINVDGKLEFSLLQVRPMHVSHEVVDLSEEVHPENLFLQSKNVLGNGTFDIISDIVYVKPELFDRKYSPEIRKEIDKFNKYLVNSKTPYLLVGFGRWGSSDPWLGIPVEWGDISGAAVIIESTLPGINVELSQGSHFFHNLSAFNVKYFSIRHDSDNNIDWQWLENQSVVNETKFVKHVKLQKPLRIKVDGRNGKGVILK